MTTLAPFVDAGMVWTDGDLAGGVRRAGIGAELKNTLRIGGLRIGHALGLAVPTDDFEAGKLYYRIRTGLPF